MINNFLILKKLDYLSEKDEKRKEIDFAVQTINTNMQRLNYVEAQKDDDTIKYVFSIGGDGTMLYAMHSTIEKESTIIGINSGKLGFLPPFLPNDLNNQNFFNFIKTENDHKIEKRSILQHNLSGLTSGFAVNEYAISAENPHNIIDISLEIETNGVISGAGHYKSNALIISSACGSTAFNLNAGGAIVDPSIKCMQIMMMAPATLASRPLIIGENSIIHVKMNNKCRVYSDNNLINDIEETHTKTLSISLMKKQSKLLLPNNWNFYDVLSKKLHWNNGGECQL